MRIPKVSLGRHRGKVAFVWHTNRKPRYRVVKEPHSPKAVEAQRAALIVEIANGLTAPAKTQVEPVTRLLSVHLQRFLDTRAWRGDFPELERRLKRITDGLTFVEQLTCDVVERVIRSRTMSQQTANHYRNIAKQLARYLWINKITPYHQLIELKQPKVRVKPRQRDRLQPEEFPKLIRTTEKSSRWFCYFDGPTRAWIYRIAAWTGFRRKELSVLTVGDFDLVTGAVSLPSSATKNGEVATIPLPTRAVRKIRKWLRGQDADRPIFPGLQVVRTAQMLAADLEEAGIPRLTKIGKRDFHALRNSFISNLWDAGLPGTVVQRLARHSTITLTVNYARPLVDDERRAVECLAVV